MVFEFEITGKVSMLGRSSMLVIGRNQIGIIKRAKGLSSARNKHHHFTRMVGSSYGRCMSTASGSFMVPDRAYIDVKGKDAVKLLQGICTQDVTDLGKYGDCIAAAFLTPKGRVLADALVYNVTLGEGAPPTHLVIETHKSMGEGLVKFLTMFKLRSRATITTGSYQSVVTLPGRKNKVVSATAAVADGGEEGVGTISVQDPRSPTLGTISLSPSPPPSEIEAEAGGNSNNHSSSVDRSMYTRYRLLNGIAEGPEIANKIPLECNLDLLNYVSFSKGCYVGQVRA